jgi:hypothetical protein
MRPFALQFAEDKLEKRFAGSVASRALLKSVDSMSCALPHSNEAAISRHSRMVRQCSLFWGLQACF